MPSQITHLVIAQKFLAKNKGLPTEIRDVKRFLDGSVLPDLDQDKQRSHCGVRIERNNLLKRNAEKVNPQKFLQTHDLCDDLDKGRYLHLYVDYQYYNVFLHDYCARVSMPRMSIDMYETTQRDERYLVEQYHVSYQDTSYAQELAQINAAWRCEHYQKNGVGYAYEIPYSIAELEAFIESMSAVELPQGQD